ncbi:MAG: hypothetical protein HQ498_08215 [Pseudohongiella sp.]|nr:hypothetical protein [Pseudohongiella sp.]
MNAQVDTQEIARYSKCIEVSKRIRWDIDKDVIRGRSFDFEMTMLPDGISQISKIDFLDPQEARFLSHIQGRTYANMFGLVERFINAKILEISRDHWLGNQTKLEALIRFSDEELKHQELFRRLERMIAEGMPVGYSFMPQPDDVASVVLTKSTWSVLGLTCLIELFTQAHYRKSIESSDNLSPLFKDVFLYHWQEESQHAILDELEWVREDNKLSEHERDQAVDDLIQLAVAVDGILQMQSRADCDYFLSINERKFSEEQKLAIHDGILKAYRWQYIFSGVELERFQKVLTGMITEEQMARIGAALETLM